MIPAILRRNVCKPKLTTSWYQPLITVKWDFNKISVLEVHCKYIYTYVYKMHLHLYKNKEKFQILSSLLYI